MLRDSDERIQQLEQERDRLRGALDVAKKWLRRFCEPSSDIWSHPALQPHEVACEALADVTLAEDL